MIRAHAEKIPRGGCMMSPTNRRAGLRERLGCLALSAALLASAACSDEPTDDKKDTEGELADVGNTVDSGKTDSGSGAVDAGSGTVDAGGATNDAGGAVDATAGDGGGTTDAGGSDAGGSGDVVDKPDGCSDKEKCNGLDDDCDGLTDEDICADDNACTVDKCLAEFEVCAHDAVKDDTPCDNGQKCNGPDYCQGGVCLPGPATNCNDGNPCTTDSCDKVKNACNNKPVADGTNCSDGSACTLGDQCGKGLCLPGSVTKCDDQNDCTTDACDPKKGCSNTLADGKKCEDGNACTVDDVCKAGKCGGGKDKACPNGKPCDLVTCHPTTGKCGLEAKKDGDGCIDSEPCMTGKACKSGKCEGGKKKDCNDGKLCTKDFCNPTGGGTCQHINTPDGAACDDGDACTTGDTCQKLKCMTKTKDCVDKNPCTTDACDPKLGCTFKNNANYCEDGNKCTEKDKCKAGKCTAGVTKDCGDGKECTVDICFPKSGVCSNDASKLEGKPCKGDNDACTVGDKCSFGKCVIGKATKCKDNDPCTLDLCDPKTAKCSYKKQGAGAACNDGSLCTYKDKCDSAGKCAGTKLPCNDSNGCTVDGCKPSTGECTFKQLKPGEKCDDDNQCTIGDQCNNQLQCVPGANKNCDDGNKCSADFCDKKTGKCGHNNAPGTCDDGSICTLSERCIGGKCAAADDGVVTTWAGSGQYGYTDGAKTSARFRYPRDVVVLKDGTMFVLDSSNYRIRRISQAGQVSTFVGSGFSVPSDGTGTKASIGYSYGFDFSEKEGVFYLADSNYHIIRRITMTGQITTVAGKSKSWGTTNAQGSSARFNRPYGVNVTKPGTIFISDENNHRIRRMMPGGQVSTFAGNSIGSNDGKGTGARFYRPHGITSDPNGILYVSDYQNHRIRRITPDGTVITLAGWSNGFANGSGTAARFYYPEAIEFSPGGFLVVADRSNHRIRKVTVTGVVTTMAGSGSSGFQNGTGTATRFNYPQGLGIDKNGLIYIGDTNNHRIRRIASSTLVCDDHSPCTADSCDAKKGCQHYKLAVGGKCTDGTKCETGGICDAQGQCKGKPKTCNDSNPCTTDQCDPVTGLCVHNFTAEACNDGDLCTEGERCTVGKCMVTTGKVITQTGSGKFGVVDGAGLAAAHYYPRGIDRDTKGNLFVTDSSGHRIRRIDKNWNVKTVGGSGSAGWTDGNALTGRFNYPTDVAVAGNGDLYVADRNNHRIRKVQGASLTTWAGSGSSSFSDGKGTAARFYYPEGIAVDTDGTVYVADSYNHRIRKIDPSQNVTTLMGNGQQSYSEGGKNEARFNRPGDVEVGEKGVLYVADSYNHRIRMIKDGKTSLLAGGSYGFVDGKGSTAQFRYPTGIDYHKGRLYVADRANNRIRVVEKDGATWTLAGQQSGGWTDGNAHGQARFNNPYGVVWTPMGVLVADSSNHRTRLVVPVTKDCDDSDPCTSDSCDNKTGKCVNAAIKGCCVPTLYHGKFDSTSDALGLSFESCSAGIVNHYPTGCAKVSGAYNSKGWQIWPAAAYKKSGGALYYGYPSGQTYKFGYKAAGRVLTKGVKVPVGVKTTLSFSILFDTSTSALYDRLHVWLVVDGNRELVGQKTPPSSGAIWYRGSGTNTPKKWYDLKFDVSKYGGKKLQLEVYFNSGATPSYNGKGIFVDDVKVVRTCGK